MKKDSNNNEEFNEEELKKIAPTLYGIQSDLSMNPFSTPEGYFDSLNREVMKKIESIPDFESAAIENPFKVPAGYFDSLPTIIQQKIIDSKAKRVSLAGWFAQVLSRPAPRYALALASVALILFFSTKYFTRTVKVEYVETPETEQLDAAYLSQLDESVLAEVYVEEISTTDAAQDEGIENYLLENDIDLNSITEQL